MEAISIRIGRPSIAAKSALTEIRPVRVVLIAGTVLFLGLFLVLPLVVVFVEALKKGVEFYFAAISEPDAAAAIRLTLLAAGIAVPLNLIFGVAAAWAISKFQFSGKTSLGYFDRLAVFGFTGDLRIDLRLALWPSRLARAMAFGA